MAALVAVIAWYGFCREGTFENCPDGSPSFELVFQFVLACAGLAVTVVLWVVVLGAWAVFLDAATHGWDDLRLLWLG